VISKLCSDSKPNFAQNDKDDQVLCWLYENVPTFKMADGHHLEKKWQIATSKQFFDRFWWLRCHMASFHTMMCLTIVILLLHPISGIKCSKSPILGI